MGSGLYFLAAKILKSNGGIMFGVAEKIQDYEQDTNWKKAFGVWTNGNAVYDGR